MARQCNFPGLLVLNKESTSRVFLMLLRTLNTSDLSFTYSLFSPDTIHDICAVSKDILEHELRHRSCDLTKVEEKEYHEYIENMQASIA